MMFRQIETVWVRYAIFIDHAIISVAYVLIQGIWKIQKENIQGKSCD